MGSQKKNAMLCCGLCTCILLCIALGLFFFLPREPVVSAEGGKVRKFIVDQSAPRLELDMDVDLTVDNQNFVDLQDVIVDYDAFFGETEIGNANEALTRSTYKSRQEITEAVPISITSTDPNVVNGVAASLADVNQAVFKFEGVMTSQYATNEFTNEFDTDVAVPASAQTG